MTNITLFAQIINHLDKISFKSLVRKFKSDKHSKGITSWTHLVAMIFLHFSQSSSLREISNGLRSATGNLNHLGVKLAPSKSSMSYINGHRDWGLFHEYFYELYDRFADSCKGHQSKLKIKSKRVVLLDSTLISLCIEVFDWAQYKSKKGGIKLHTLLDYDTCLPAYVLMTEGKVNDGAAAWYVPLPENSVVVADRGYQDFGLMNNWDSCGNQFVVRLKENTQFTVLKENALPETGREGVIVDQIVELTRDNTYEKYPRRLRRVVVYDEVNKEPIEVITNNFKWASSTISKLYRSRWQIEIFFKELKQHLKIKSFVGTSINAVLIQIWTAMITILILKYLKAIAKYGWNLSNLIAFLRLNLFVKNDLQQWLDHPFEVIEKDVGAQNQLFLIFRGG